MSSPEPIKRGNRDPESSSSSSVDEEYCRRRKKQSKKQKRKRRHDDESSTNSSDGDDSYKRHKKKRKKHKKKKLKERKKSRRRKDNAQTLDSEIGPPDTGPEDPVQPTALSAAHDNSVSARRTIMAPMSKEQYDAQQSQVRQVFDPESGRVRLVRGSGEIIESIVSRSQHAQINRTATQGDGAFYARSIVQAGSKTRKR